MIDISETAPEPVNGEPPALCTVCEHSLASHRPVSLRYCRATQAHAYSRRCICR